MKIGSNNARKRIEHESRRRFILNAARRILAIKGIDNTNMDDIAAAADYTRRTLYTYFDSRDEILLAIFIEDLTIRWTVQKEAITRVSTGLERIIAWGESFYSYACRNPHAMRLHMYWDFRGIERKRISSRAFKDFETINNELTEGLRDIFRRGVKDGSMRSDLKIDLCIGQYIDTLRCVINRAISPIYTSASFEPDEYVKHYLDLFSRAIRSTPAIRK